MNEPIHNRELHPSKWPVFSEEEIIKAIHLLNETGEVTPPAFRWFDQYGKPYLKHEVPAADPMSFINVYFCFESSPKKIDPSLLETEIDGEKVLLSSYRIPNNPEEDRSDQYARILGNLIVKPGSILKEYPKLKSLEGILIMKPAKNPVRVKFPNLEFLGGVSGAFDGALPSLEVINYLLESPYPLSLPKLNWVGGKFELPNGVELLPQIGRKTIMLPFERPTYAAIATDFETAIKQFEADPESDVQMDAAKILMEPNGYMAEPEGTNFKEPPLEKGHFVTDTEGLLVTLENGETVFLGSINLNEGPPTEGELSSLYVKIQPYQKKKAPYEVIIPYDYIMGDLTINPGKDDPDFWEVIAPNLKKIGGRLRIVDTESKFPELVEVGGITIECKEISSETVAEYNFPNLKIIEGSFIVPYGPEINLPKTEYVGSIEGQPDHQWINWAEMPKLKQIAGSALFDTPNYNPDMVKHRHWAVSDAGLDAMEKRTKTREALRGNQPPIEI